MSLNSARFSLAVTIGLLGSIISPACIAKSLLPADAAFSLSALAPSRDRIQIQWKIADGYYLYRHRIAITPRQDFSMTTALSLPSGDKKTDPHFGVIEIYRKTLVATQQGIAQDGIDHIPVNIQYQGCADSGACYPLQTRQLTVALPPSMPGLSGLSLPTTHGLNKTATQMSALPLPAEQAFMFEGNVDDGNHLLLRFTPKPGYYLYRDRISFAIEGILGIHPGLPQWPKGVSHHDEHFGDVIVYFDQADVRLPLVRERANPTDMTLVATFQGCQTNGICYPPMTRRVRLSLPAGRLSAPGEAAAVPLIISSANNRQAITTNLSGQRSGYSHHSLTQGQPTFSRPEPQHQPLILILLLALLGGLILNLMPCVLPILSLKVLGLATSAESRMRARRHATWYTAGVLVSFTGIGSLAITLRAAGLAAGWGFQLQQPGFVTALVYLLFAIGLSLSGVFTLGGRMGRLTRFLTARDGLVGDFFTGILACAVASPCIAPFMGTALAYAFTAPASIAFLVFLLLGIGLALPFLIIGFVPSLASRLPRPGAWMETLKQLLAFPLYLSTIWLLWVLGKQRGIDAVALALIGLVWLAIGLWSFERTRWQGQGWRAAVAPILIMTSLWPLWKIAHQLPLADGHNLIIDESGAVPYSPQLLQRLRADNRVVFVNITADWCVTCMANERNVLRSQSFHNALRDVDAVYMKADWTNPDPQIENFLNEQHAVGVPLYVVYGPGSPPITLPTLLSQAMAEDALRRAAH